MTHLIDQARTALESQFLAGGVLLLVLGLLTRQLARLRAGALALVRLLAVSVEVSSDSALHDDLVQWLARRRELSKGRRLTATVRWVDMPDGSNRDLVISRAPGGHFLRHAGRLFWIERVREDPPSMPAGSHAPRSLPPFERIHVTTLARGQESIRDLLDEVFREARERERETLGVFSYRSGCWTRVSGRAPRPLASVVLPRGVAEGLLADVRRFLAMREWYAHRGVPYRRGYLLHGPPGTGKSSIIEAIAGECRLALHLLPVGGLVTDELLLEAVAEVPPCSVLLLEDVDAVAPARDSDRKGVTLSGLLNALDGVGAPEGVLVFMTTNHPERLDPALVRPGRADVRLELGPAGEDEVLRALARFYDEDAARGAEARALARRCASARLTMAQVQQLFLASPLAPPPHEVAFAPAIAPRIDAFG